MVKKNDEQNKKILGFSNEVLKSFEFVGSLILIINLKGIVVFINRKGCEVLGCDKGEIIGRNWVDDFLPARIKIEVEKLLHKILSDKGEEIIKSYENPVLTSTGEERVILWSNKMIKDKKGAIIGTLSSGEDITEIKESEKKLTEAEFTANIGHWERNMATNEYTCSDGCLHILGYKPGDISPTYENFSSLFHKDDVEEISNIINNAIADNKEEYTFEGRIIRPDGEIRFIKSTAYIIKNSLGKITKTNGIIADITEIKKYEEKILQNYDRLEKAEELARMGSWVRDLKTGEYTCSNGLFKIGGENRVEVKSTFEELVSHIHEEEREYCIKLFKEASLKGEAFMHDFRIVKHNGDIRYARCKVTYIKDKTGVPVKASGVIIDITDQKLSELRLMESEKSFNELFANILDAFAIREIVYDEEENIIGYRLIESNKKFNKTFNAENLPDEPICEPCLSKEAICYDIYERVAKTGISEAVTLFCPFTKKYFEVSVYSLKKNTFATIHKDITEKKKNELSLMESEKRYRTIFDQAALGICNISLDGKFLTANKKCCEILGYSLEELIEITIFDITFQEDMERSNAIFLKLTSGEIDDLTIEKKYIRKDGKSIDVDITAVMLRDSQNKPLYTVSTIQDITEMKNLEKEKLILEAYLRNQQKLESIGTLAGGVAHEINNPINGIMNYAQLLLDMCETGSESSEYLKEIIFETERISTIVKNLLQFSRHGKKEHSYSRIEDIIERTLSLIRTVIKHDQISLKINIHQGLPDVKCRSQQIQQVIMNLLTNARDALNERYSGYDEDKICKLNCRQFKNGEGNWIRITVEDHGNGIKKDIQDRIFEPFFTTKGRDVGTGLGLSISYGIVKEHNGELSFETKEGKYTKFHLDLPVDNGWKL